jgi:hypothetical protein
MVLSSRLNKACYAIRAIKPHMSLNAMRMIYRSYVHSISSYGIILGGNASYNESIFKIQNIIIRVITSSGRLVSCCGLFKKLQILPLQSKYIFSLLLFVAKKRNYFIASMDTHDIDTHYNYSLYLPSTDLSTVQKGVFFSGSKIYNHIPLNIKLLSKNIKVFKSSLWSFLIENVFSSIDGYYNFTSQLLFFI